MPASVEADGHVRVAASVPVDGARLSGADKGARAPANWSPLAPPVSVWVSLDPVSVPGARRPTGHPRCLRVCRSASVCPWRAPLPAGGRPAQGAPANWSPCRPPARRPPPRQLGQPTGRRALACAPPPPPPPPRPPRPPFVALARATLCSPRGRAPTGPPAPLNRLPSTGTLARAAGGPSPTHTHRPRPAHHRARKRSRVRTSFRGEAHLRRQTARRPCGHVPRSPRPSRPANWRESMEVEIPRGPAVTGAPPRLRRKVSGPPSKRPALPARLVTSVVCRGFIPARGDIAIRQPAPGGFSPGAVASLLRYMARRPIRIQLRRAGLHRRVPARILT
ncbi:hypothetical protein KXX32_008479 [Aspergillus fumigatus]|nr:hypothetical protein KXX32_008479 [Aspergillus fumigatus]